MNYTSEFFDDELLTLPEVLTILRISKTTFHYEIKKGRYPKPLKLSAHRSLWLKSQIFASIKRMNPDAAI